MDGTSWPGIRPQLDIRSILGLRHHITPKNTKQHSAMPVLNNDSSLLMVGFACHQVAWCREATPPSHAFTLALVTFLHRWCFLCLRDKSFLQEDIWVVAA